jgi:hypothetical protein
MMKIQISTIQTFITRRRYILLPVVAFFAFLTVVEAKKLQDFQQGTYVRDTTVQKDTTPAPDPKSGCRSQFVHSDLGSGISEDKINPMAVSFVQD